MPSRRVEEPCPKCGAKNSLRSKYCNQCGSQLPHKEINHTESDQSASADRTDRRSEHRDIAHPINMETREYIQKKILQAYEDEKNKKPEERVAHTSGEVSSAEGA